MLQEPLTLYKLIVLYMLDKVSFPLTTAQISELVLEKEYTNFLTLQQILNELSEAGMISSHAIRNRTMHSLTPEGSETLQYFKNRIGDAIKADIDSYLEAHEYTLRNEVSILSDFYKSTSGEYNAHLIAKDREINLVEITLSVPTKEMAADICDKWQVKNQEIYQLLVEKLF